MKIQQSYARVLGGENSTRFVRIDEVASVEDQVIKQLKGHKPELSACHTLGKPAEDRTQEVIVRFVSRKSKVMILMNARNLKGTGICINEHLRASPRIDLAKSAKTTKVRGSADFLHICTVGYPYGTKANPKRIRHFNVSLSQGRYYWIWGHFGSLWFIFDAEISDILFN